MTEGALTREQQRLVLDNQGFARKAARFYARKYRGVLSPDDVTQLTQLAIVESARTFDPSRGTAFATFAWLRISGRVSDAVREETGEPAALREHIVASIDLQDPEVDLDATETGALTRAKTAVAQAAAAAILALVTTPPPPERVSPPTGPNPDPEADLLAREFRSLVAEAVAKLPENRQRVLSLYYTEDRPLRAVAQDLGASYATTRRWHDDALDKLAVLCSRGKQSKG